MFTNEDFREYFRQIREMEVMMAALYERIANDLLAGEIRDALLKLQREEEAHDQFVKKWCCFSKTIDAGGRNCA